MPSQAQELDWATRAGGTGFERGFGIAADNAGNSYVTGPFGGTAIFGAGEANETTLTPAGGLDIFVAKYDPSGALVWAKRAGGGGIDLGSAIATDGDANSYVTGRFSGTATFGAGDTNETILTGTNDIFVAKYDPSGALVWAKRAGGGTSGKEGLGIATDAAGNSYITGWFSGTATFGAGGPNETTLTVTGGGFDIFVARYDPDGALIWAKRVGADASHDEGHGVATDSAGHSYVTGFFHGTAIFGAGEPNETTLTSAGNSTDMFLAKYDAEGALLWATSTAGAAEEDGRGLATDSAGNSYVTGRFTGVPTFGAGEPNETTLTETGDNDIFVARYDPDGMLVWAKAAGGTSRDLGLGVATDGAGIGYVTGRFLGTATFGLGEPNETTLTAAVGNDDIFVAKYQPDGALVWAKRADGGGSEDPEQGIATDGIGNSYVTGVFDGAVTFGAGEPNETTLTSAGGDDIFIAKFSGVVDADGDGIADDDDNCPDEANANQLDTDGDTDGDACDADDDNDTVADAGDNCPLDPNTNQADADGDGAGDACDADLDGDGVIDSADACVPTQTGAVVNADGCSIADLVPCNSPWKNHGAYVSTIVKTAKDFLDLGLITEEQRAAIVSAVAQSECGQ